MHDDLFCHFLILLAFLVGIRGVSLGGEKGHSIQGIEV